MSLDNKVKAILEDLHKEDIFPSFNLEISGIEYREGIPVIVIHPNHDKWTEEHARALIRDFRPKIDVSGEFEIKPSTGEIVIKLHGLK